MELKQFISEALINIVEGVDEANSKFKNRFRIIGERHNITQSEGAYAEFDVSVVVNEGSKNKIKGSTSSSFLSVLSAKVEGEQNKDNSLQNAHRLKFKIYISEK